LELHQTPFEIDGLPKGRWSNRHVVFSWAANCEAAVWGCFLVCSICDETVSRCARSRSPFLVRRLGMRGGVGDQRWTEVGRPFPFFGAGLAGLLSLTVGLAVARRWRLAGLVLAGTTCCAVGFARTVLQSFEQGSRYGYWVGRLDEREQRWLAEAEDVVEAG